MIHVIGKKYIAPKAAVVVGLFFLFLVFIGIGIYLSVQEHNLYLAELDLYEIELYNYYQGYTYTKPVEPSDHIWQYFLINGLAVVVGLICCGLLYYAFALEKHTNHDIIIYDDEKQLFGVYKDCSYKEIPVNSITSIERQIIPGGVYTGRIWIPIFHKTSSIVFKYEDNGRRHSVTSEPVKEPDDVIASIELIRRKAMKDSMK